LPKTEKALELGSKAEMEGSSLVMPQLAFLPITINGWITMAPNLALSKHILRT
jgi:hypothetical protein